MALTRRRQARMKHLERFAHSNLSLRAEASARNWQAAEKPACKTEPPLSVGRQRAAASRNLTNNRRREVSSKSDVRPWKRAIHRNSTRVNHRRVPSVAPWRLERPAALSVLALRRRSMRRALARCGNHLEAARRQAYLASGEITASSMKQFPDRYDIHCGAFPISSMKAVRCGHEIGAVMNSPRPPAVRHHQAL